MATPKKLPPRDKGKSAAQQWKEFGDFMNARDVKGNPRAQGDAIKSRALAINKYLISKGGGAKNIPGGVSGSSTSAAKKPKKVVGSVARSEPKVSKPTAPNKSSKPVSRGALPPTPNRGPRPPATPKRPVRGGGSFQGDLAKFGAQIKRNKAATGTKAKQMTNRMSKGY